MTSMFDSKVYQRRRHTPWARMCIEAFMRAMAWNVPAGASPTEHAVVLTCRYRRDVSTGMWWTLEWTGADGERHCVASQELDLCLWRAAQRELDSADEGTR